MTQPMSAKRVLKPSPAIRGQTLIDDWRRSGFRASHGTPALLHFPPGREENAGSPEYLSDRDHRPDFAPPFTPEADARGEGRTSRWRRLRVRAGPPDAARRLVAPAPSCLTPGRGV